MTTARVRALVAAAVAAIALAHPHIVPRYAAYVAGRVFLGPFPDLVSCDMEVRGLASGGSAATCRRAFELAWGDREDRLLAADFSGPILAERAFCRLDPFGTRTPARASQL